MVTERDVPIPSSPQKSPGLSAPWVEWSWIGIAVFVRHDTAVIRANALVYGEIDQLAGLCGFWIVRMIFQVRDQSHDTVKWLMLSRPAPMPWLEVTALCKSQEAMDIFSAVYDDTVASYQPDSRMDVITGLTLALSSSALVVVHAAA